MCHVPTYVPVCLVDCVKYDSSFFSFLEQPGFEKKIENQENSHPPARAIHFQTASPKIEMN
jgi:hypothetical protein